jgi:predicted adenine nucleotide alpha hydrolase (AANH) superfamily ATPase
MKILLHICCAPCSIYPIRILKEGDTDVMGFFFRDNIHPFTECLRRQETLTEYAEKIDVKLIIPDDYNMEYFLRSVVFREKNRCAFCYHARLEATAKLARRGKFDAFSTTLLYSKFQKHDLVRSIGESVGKSIGIPFYYQDFRDGWKEGVQTSRDMGMYRQPYCGCIYSEKERYFK